MGWGSTGASVLLISSDEKQEIIIEVSNRTVMVDFYEYFLWIGEDKRLIFEWFQEKNKRTIEMSLDNYFEMFKCKAVVLD